MIPVANLRWAAAVVACGLVVSVGAVLRTPSCAPLETSTAVDEDCNRPRVADAKRPGGETTVALGPVPSFAVPAANLDAVNTSRFYAGKALASQPWVRAPTQTDARDGLGPLYNARSCLACHVKGGRGEAARGDDVPLFASLVRLSLPGRGPHGEPVPDPVYGTQLQSRSTSLSFQLRGQSGADQYAADGVPAEGDAFVRWNVESFVYPDGNTLQLRSPALSVRNLGYGSLHPHARLGIRHAPSLTGMGLLERIDPADIERRADPQDRDGDGIAGRVNRVWDLEAGAMRAGRFGLKANQPSLRQQVAAALHADMGLSNPVFADQPCTSHQTGCVRAPTGNDDAGYEVPEELLQLVVFFTASLGVPEQRMPDHPLVVRGRGLFSEVGCDDCHTPHYVTVADADRPHLSEQPIWPYTDLLLHDMGPDLADGRDDHLASGSQWRTSPLWGVGLARSMLNDVGLLHDGRARTVEEAIVWHGAEARSSRDRFVALEAEDRRALLAFVRSI